MKIDTANGIKTALQLMFGAMLIVAADLAAAGDVLVEPLFVRYARMYTAPTLDATAEYFKDSPLEEADDFDGYRIQFDYTHPLSDISQLEVILPVYTNGDGTYYSNNYPTGVDVDIEGYGGSFVFPSLVYERRFGWLEGKTGLNNAAWLAGFGYVIEPLDADLKSNGQLVDRFNHSGHKVILGLKADDEIADGRMTGIGNIVFTYFLDTDDINPSDNGINFPWLEIKGALIFNQYGSLKPALEAMATTDFSDYTAFSLAPEILYSVGDSWDLKLGAPFRLTSDGEKYAARLEVTHRF